ncbi:hypothetical protein K492DRAFT_192113 [Lichtheimia hyalospora FSU 10163]|nr:hypothetical protein K492DRAFT_192113 [Lichtheimia hyalospora FSU 10163]
MTRYDDEDGKQDITGRKIVLTIGGHKESQQIKNGRTNKTILKWIEKLPIDEKDKKGLFVLGMAWIGTIGYMMSMRALDGGYVAQHVQDLHLPQTLGNVGTFENTLDCLFAFKHHQEHLRQVVEAGYDLQRTQEILQVYRTPSIRQRSASHDTLFTPKRKGSRRTRLGARQPVPHYPIIFSILKNTCLHHSQS